MRPLDSAPRRSDSPRPPARGRGGVRPALLLAAALWPAPAIAEATAPVEAAPDPTLRAALERVRDHYLDPGRVDPGAMLRGALRGMARAEGSLEATVDDGQLALRRGAELRSIPPPAAAGDLVARLAPSLEAALEWAAGGASTAGRDDLRAALLNGALKTLDRFSGAYASTGRDRLMDRFTGTLVGIGVRLQHREEALVIAEVYPETGAQKAGLQAGDQMLRVDGKPVAGLSARALSARLRGEEGTTVEIEVLREAPRSFTVTRTRYTRPTVTRIPRSGRIAVLRISHISRNTAGQVGTAVRNIAADPEAAGLVLDLRGNTGGSMLTAGRIADLFLAEGVLLEALDGADRPVPGLRSRVEASPGGLDLPLAVVVDGRTGSSAELLAAALAWNDRAILVGERSYGKNVVQKLYQFDEADLTVKLSVAYLRAAERRLPADGLVPDVAVATPSGADEADEDLADEDGSASAAEIVAGDPVERAVEILARHGARSAAETRRRMGNGDRPAVNGGPTGGRPRS